DEVGQLSTAINSFMDTVSESLERVQDTSHSLADSASKLTAVAQSTDKAANNQQLETSEVQSNITDMLQQQTAVEDSTNNAT
ncbi:methyl-accepting chemotaxis protein, partial [Vibrio sp. Vb2880]|nr:methyl-accepting chemotaxis protein [Vibrio sp. Vb2880]